MTMKRFLSVGMLFLYSVVTAFQMYAQEKRFTILHTSDEHSTLLPLPLTEYHPYEKHPGIGGFARLSSKVKSIQAAKGAEPVVLLSAGDIMGGSPFAWLILKHQSIELDLMNQIGYAAMTIGNHEFDYGPDILADYFLRAGYQKGHQHPMKVIAANLNIPTGHRLLEVEITPWQILQLDNGLKLGLVGVLGASAYSLAPGAKEVTIHDQFNAAQKAIDQLRSDGADVIVLLSHSGIEEDRQMAKKLKGVDVILGGHDHIKTPEPEVVNQTVIVHPGYYLQYVGKLEFAYDTPTGKLKLLNGGPNSDYLQSLDSNVPEDSTVAGMIAVYTDSLNAFIGHFTENRFSDISASVIQSNFPVVKERDLSESSIGNFVTDAMRIIGSEVIGDRVDFAFQGNGVIRAEILPGQMPWSKKQFALFDLLTIVGLGSGKDKMPGYPMVSVYMTAKEIFNVLEVTSMLSQFYADNFFLQVSGLRYTYDPGKSMWGRIPFLNLPLPATRAVKSVHLYRGNDPQREDGEWVELRPESEGLYHIVTDYYLAAFLPMVKDKLPKMEIIFKNKQGETVNIDDCIVKNGGHEFKIWEAVARYAQQTGDMPELYKAPQGRIIEDRGIPLYVFTLSAMALLLIIIIGLVVKLKSRKSAA
jgi:5'-nucleotidase / UDP-sugar diphosphatase